MIGIFGIRLKNTIFGSCEVGLLEEVHQGATCQRETMWKHQFHMEIYEVLYLPLPKRNLHIKYLSLVCLDGDR